MALVPSSIVAIGDASFYVGIHFHLPKTWTQCTTVTERWLRGYRSIWLRAPEARLHRFSTKLRLRACIFKGLDLHIGDLDGRFQNCGIWFERVTAAHSWSQSREWPSRVRMAVCFPGKSASGWCQQPRKRKCPHFCKTYSKYSLGSLLLLRKQHNKVCSQVEFIVTAHDACILIGVRAMKGAMLRLHVLV
jgi:hypothetical protein